MGDVARAGRTVVLVTHQMNQIRRLCHRVLWVDEGTVRQNGNAHEVLAAYESAMFSTDRRKGLQRGTGAKAQFLRWEIAGAGAARRHILATPGPVTVSVTAELARSVAKGEHGLALFNAERQLIWAHGAQNITLDPGVHTFLYTFPYLPLRPGVYQWQVSLWDGGEMLDLWDCVPDMNVATENHQHHMDEWNGILNIPSRFAIESPEERAVGIDP